MVELGGVCFNARWRSTVSRLAHNQEIVGSNPTCATNYRTERSAQFSTSCAGLGGWASAHPLYMRSQGVETLIDALFGGPVAANDNRKACKQCGGSMPRPKRSAGRQRDYCDSCRGGDAKFTSMICDHCGSSMQGRRRRFCDASCRVGFRSIELAKQAKRPSLVSGCCVECGASFVGRQDRKYCSDACARRKMDAAYKRGDKAPLRTCLECGSTFNRRPQKRDQANFCGKSCAGASIAREILVGRILSGDAEPPRYRITTSRVSCVACFSFFWTRSSGAKYCSDSCWHDINRRRAAERSFANDNVDRSVRPCGECGSPFSPSYGEKNYKFCSAPCSKRNIRRRAKMKRDERIKGSYSERVDPIKVFDRDKWKCQGCGCKTPRSLRGTYDDKAPELDHIMPLSLGGAHSYMNTQCLCRKCNGAKSNVPPAQVSLFAYG